MIGWKKLALFSPPTEWISYSLMRFRSVRIATFALKSVRWWNSVFVHFTIFCISCGFRFFPFLIKTEPMDVRFFAPLAHNALNCSSWSWIKRFIGYAEKQRLFHGKRKQKKHANTHSRYNACMQICQEMGARHNHLRTRRLHTCAWVCVCVCTLYFMYVKLLSTGPEVGRCCQPVAGTVGAAGSLPSAWRVRINQVNWIELIPVKMEIKNLITNHAEGEREAVLCKWTEMGWNKLQTRAAAAAVAVRVKWNAQKYMNRCAALVGANGPTLQRWKWYKRMRKSFVLSPLCFACWFRRAGGVKGSLNWKMSTTQTHTHTQSGKQVRVRAAQKRLMANGCENCAVPAAPTAAL